MSKYNTNFHFTMTANGSNGIRAHNPLVCKQTLNHLAKLRHLAKMIIYKLSGCGFQFCCCPLNFRHGGYFEQGVLDIQANYRV